MRAPLAVTVPVTEGLNLFSQRRDLLFQFAHLSAWKSLLLLSGLPPPPPLSTCGDWMEARPPRFLPVGLCRPGSCFPGAGISGKRQ